MSHYHRILCMCQSISAAYINKARISKIGMREVAPVYVRRRPERGRAQIGMSEEAAAEVRER